MKEIYVYLEGNDFKYDIRALLKALYPSKEIIFVEEKALVDNQSLLIEIILLKEDRCEATTIISKNEKVISESTSYIKNIDIQNDDEKRILKLGVKQSILQAVSSVNDMKMPWGVLTGIRPTKIVHELLDKNIESSMIIEILIDQYKLDHEKASLITDIALGERKYIYPLDKDKYSLYISIPFCPTRCLYCSFPSNDIEKSREFVEIYTEKLVFELIEMSKVMSEKTLDTVYIGGGTPTAIPVSNLDKIIKTVYEYFGTDAREFTVEAGRPDTIDLAMLTMLKDNNIKRISINPQTMNEETLKTIGRNHTVEDIVESFNMARKLGFESINMDLIVGLPGEDKIHVEKTMEYIKKLKPENLTVHTMALKRTSKLKKYIDDYDLTDQLHLEDMLNVTKKYAVDMELNPYYMYRQKQILGNFENIGYSLKGHECIYNMLIMEEKQTIIAVGAGATSKFYSPLTGKIERVPNLKDLREYVSRVEEMVEKKRSEVYVNKSTKRD